MNRDQATCRADQRARHATVALLLTAALLCWGLSGPSAFAQANQTDTTASESPTPFSDFFRKLHSDGSKTVVYRWRGEETVLIEGREQQLTGEQVRLDDTGETYTVYYSEDGFLLEEYSARHQLRWPGSGSADDALPLPPGVSSSAQLGPTALPPSGRLFTDDPTMELGYFAEPVVDPSLRSDPTIVRSRRIETDDTQSLIDFSPATGRTLEIDLFSDTKVEAEFTRLKQIASNSFILAGNVLGEPSSDVTLSVVNNAIAGRIQSAEHGTFLLRSNSGGGMLTEVDFSQYAGCGSDSLIQPSPSTGPGADPVLAAASSVPPVVLTDSGADAPEGTVAGDIPGTFGGDLGIDTPGPGPGGVNLDLLVIYTPAVIEWLTQEFPLGANGFSEITELFMALVHSEVFDMNTALINSAVSHRFRLVHVEEVNFTESRNPIPNADPPQDIYDGAAGSADLASLRSTADGIMDLIHNTRDYVGADFVHLIVEPSELNEDETLELLPIDICGIGYIRQLLTDFADSAFAITVLRCFGGLTLPHELGHNLGLAHDRLNADVFGLFTYSFGNYFIGNTNAWRTIMAYPGGGTIRANVFSSPNVLFDGGVPGVPIGSPGEADNATTIEISGPSSATWRDEVITTQLANIATRGYVGTGDEVLIGGFILESKLDLIRFDDNNTTIALDPNHPEEESAKSDSTPIPDDPGVLKKILVRGRGPSLAGSGLGGLLADPTISLFRGSELIATNDDWKDTQQAEIAATGAAPAVDAESAILAHLPAGEYTVILSGVGGGTGLGIVEVLVFEPDNRTSISTRLLDISTRGKIGTGDQVLIGGFILEGPEPAEIAILARGPSLNGILGNGNVIDDPKIEVYSGGSMIASSDNWLTEASAQVLQDAGVAPPSIFEAGTVLLLSPGPYTVIVRGNGPPVMGQGIGLGIVEAFEIQDFTPQIDLESPIVLDFGDVVWNTSSTRTVTITNTSLVDFKILPFADQFSSPFSTTDPDALIGGTIPPGASASLTVTFTALTAGESYSKNIFIETNAIGTPVITLKLKGRVVVPL